MFSAKISRLLFEVGESLVLIFELEHLVLNGGCHILCRQIDLPLEARSRGPLKDPDRKAKTSESQPMHIPMPIFTLANICFAIHVHSQLTV